MAGWWRALPRAAGRYPWLSNVLLYGALSSAGDALQQRLSGGPADWRHTRCVATLAVVFHANYNYVWQHLLERAVPGRTPRAILIKVLCDQAVSAPVAISAFYTGMSILQGKDDIFLDLKQKFWNTYKMQVILDLPGWNMPSVAMRLPQGITTEGADALLSLIGDVNFDCQVKSGLMYWPFVQLTNFSLVPIQWRTAYTGLYGFLWVSFLCYSQQSGDGTLKSAFTFLHPKEASQVERPSEK